MTTTAKETSPEMKPLPLLIAFKWMLQLGDKTSVLATQFTTPLPRGISTPNVAPVVCTSGGSWSFSTGVEMGMKITVYFVLNLQMPTLNICIKVGKKYTYST